MFINVGKHRKKLLHRITCVSDIFTNEYCLTYVLTLAVTSPFKTKQQ
jgi:hypothetical protein